jgi:ATP-binding cassette subfamily B protein
MNNHKFSKVINQARHLYPKFSSFISILIRALLEIYNVKPSTCHLLIATIIIGGIFPSLIILTTSNIIQLLSIGMPYDMSLLAIEFSLWGLAIFIQNLIMPVELYFQTILSDQVTTHVNSRLIKKANSFQSIEIFDKQEFHDNLELLKTQSYHKPLNLIVTLFGILRDGIIILSCSALIFSVVGMNAVLILICAMLNSFMYVRIQALIWQDSFNRSKRARFISYLATLAINLKYVKELRFFNYASHIEALHKSKSKQLFLESRNFKKKIVLKSLLPLAASTITTIFLTFFAFERIVDNAIGIGAITLLIQSLIQVQRTTNIFSEQCGWMQGHILFFEKYFAFLDSENEVAKHSYQAISAPFNITFQSVGFAYPTCTNALNDLNFTIAHKETVAIVGANGAGKSTLIKLLCGLYKQSSGKILINGVNINNIDPKTWRESISPVFQDFGTYDLTLKENITCNQIDNAKFNEILQRADISYLADKLDVSIGKTFGGMELSTGQWQKVAIARALCNDGEIFILDEPTASLDPISEYEIFKKFEEISQDKTVIFVTHRLNTVVIADKIIFMDGGKILDVGTHLELMSRCLQYKEMFDKQAEHFIKLTR